MDGEFTTSVKNTESVFCDGEIREKTKAFVHFTRERSGENFTLLDIQGVG